MIYIENTNSSQSVHKKNMQTINFSLPQSRSRHESIQSINPLHNKKTRDTSEIYNRIIATNYI